MRNFALLGVIGALIGASGCNTLRARQSANDAAALYKKGDLKGAAQKYEEAAALDSKIAAVHLNLGFTYLSLFSASPKSKEGNVAGGKALTEFQKYIELKPDDPRGRNYLVQTFVDTNRYTDAVAYFKPEVDRNPPSLEAIKTLGIIASKTGRIDDALNWYQRRVAITPTDPDAHYNLGVLVWDYLHNHVDVVGDTRIQMADRGIASLKKAIELRPHAFEAYTYTNLVYRERANGQTDEAKKAEDNQEADKFMKEALSLIKAQGGAKPAAPAAPAAPGAK
jgi:tetratricopeptide (TPR) repeat protein